MHEVNQILALHDQGLSLRQIGVRIGRSHTYVSRTLHNAGRVLDTSKTANATAARMAMFRAERVRLAEQAMNDAEEMRRKVWEPYELILKNKHGVFLVILDEPPLPEQAKAVEALVGYIKEARRLTDGFTEAPEQSSDASILAELHRMLDEAVNGSDKQRSA